MTKCRNMTIPIGILWCHHISSTICRSPAANFQWFNAIVWTISIGAKSINVNFNNMIAAHILSFSLSISLTLSVSLPHLVDHFRQLFWYSICVDLLNVTGYPEIIQCGFVSNILWMILRDVWSDIWCENHFLIRTNYKCPTVCWQHFQHPVLHMHAFGDCCVDNELHMWFYSNLLLPLSNLYISHGLIHYNNLHMRYII